MNDELMEKVQQLYRDMLAIHGNDDEARQKRYAAIDAVAILFVRTYEVVYKDALDLTMFFMVGQHPRGIVGAILEHDISGIFNNLQHPLDAREVYKLMSRVLSSDVLGSAEAAEGFREARADIHRKLQG